MAGSARARDSWFWGCGIEPHVGCRDHLNKLKLKKKKKSFKKRQVCRKIKTEITEKQWQSLLSTVPTCTNSNYYGTVCKARIACLSHIISCFHPKSRIFKPKVMFIWSYIYSDLFFNVFCVCVYATWAHLWYFWWIAKDSKRAAQLLRVLSRLAHLISEIQEIISLWFTLYKCITYQRKSTFTNSLPVSMLFFFF